MGVAIRGAIPITAKMAPQQLKIILQWRCHQRWQNAIPGIGVPYLAILEREMRGCKMAVSDFCSSQQLYFILYLTSLIIFFNKSIKLLKWHPNLAPTIGAKTLFSGAKTLFKVAK